LKSRHAALFGALSAPNGTPGAITFLNEGTSHARKPNMTPNTFSSPVANASSVTAALETAAAEKLLRDMAYVLKLTRRVKDEMTADRVPTQNTASVAEGVLVA
jgi:hypothetical protein